jgi:hypothetical protein
LADCFDLVAPFVEAGGVLTIAISNAAPKIWKVVRGKRVELYERREMVEVKRGLVCPDCGYVFDRWKKTK